MDAKLLEACRAAFAGDAPALTLGAPLRGAECAREPLVRVPLAMMNRHGLIAGATGTGKTKTLQLMAEQLSSAGVPVFLADLKGDLSGLGAAGEPGEKIAQRAADTGWTWAPAPVPVEFLSLSGARGAQLRATVSSFGPLLLAKVLALNDTQSGVLALVFKLCDDRDLELYDLGDLRAVLDHLTGAGPASSRATAPTRSRAPACCCASWSSSRPRARARSSASRSSTSTICCRSNATAAAW